MRRSNSDGNLKFWNGFPNRFSESLVDSKLFRNLFWVDYISLNDHWNDNYWSFVTRQLKLFCNQVMKLKSEVVAIQLKNSYFQLNNFGNLILRLVQWLWCIFPSDLNEKGTNWFPLQPHSSIDAHQCNRQSTRKSLQKVYLQSVLLLCICNSYLNNLKFLPHSTIASPVVFSLAFEYWFDAAPH